MSYENNQILWLVRPKACNSTGLDLIKEDKLNHLSTITKEG